MGSEIIATALEQLAYLLREYPMQAGIVTKIQLSNDLEEIAIQFSIGTQTANLRPLELVLALQGSKKAAAILTLTVVNVKTEETELRETINLKHLDDAYPYFEKALDLFNQEEME